MHQRLGDGEMTLWFHPVCAAYKRPAPFLEAIETAAGSFEAPDWMKAEARRGVEHRRLPRLDGARRAPTGRARCRSCRTLIDKDAWRIPLVYYEEGRFQPSGFIHVRCCRDYFESDDVIERIRHFSPDLTQSDLDELHGELAAAGGA